MAAELKFTVGGASELEELSRRLKDQRRGDLQKKLRSNITKAARPVQGQLRAAARSVQVRSSKGGQVRPDTSTGLRARVARAVRISVTRKGVRFVVSASQVDPQYGASLPRYLDGELPRYRRWRHPVFGDAETWAMQFGSPWFFRTIRRHTRRVEQAIGEAMDETAREIAGR